MMGKKLERFKAMSDDERFEYMATADRVTVGVIEQVDETKKRIKRYYVAKVRGITVSSNGRYLFDTEEEASQFGLDILANWRTERRKKLAKAQE